MLYYAEYILRRKNPGNRSKKSCGGIVKILFSWVGHSDLLSFGCDYPEYQGTVSRLVGKSQFFASGPLKTAAAQMTFDRLILLWSYPDCGLMHRFESAFGKNASCIHVPVADPTDYREIYCAAADVLSEYASDQDHRNFFLLSPGTPAMAAVWVLLGKTRFPGTFLQAYKNAVSETVIPFDLTAELLPELLRKTDRLLETLPDVSQVSGFEEIVGCSPAVCQAVSRAAKAAIHNVPVLISGESGTGKEMFARAMWKAGPRRDKSFEAINCAALPSNLLEAELFGYKKGAFTGAVKDHPGAFARLSGGTLFLDEIGECSLELQAKLLRVLQPPPGKSLSYREFYPIGADAPECSDVKIIAATNRDLQEMVRQRLFREDLYFRLAAITLVLPPLRERGDDVLLLAEKLLDRINRDFKRETPEYIDKKFCGDTKIFVKNYPWYGNVRELFNSILQGVVMSEGEIIKISDMGLHCISDMPEESEKVVVPESGFSLDDMLESIERQYIMSALEQTSFNKSRAAGLLGFSNYQRLDARIRKLKIPMEGK